MIEKYFQKSVRGNDEVALDKLIVSLSCGFTLQNIKYPARG